MTIKTLKNRPNHYRGSRAIFSVCHRPKSASNITRWAYVSTHGYVTYYTETGQYRAG